MEDEPLTDAQLERHALVSCYLPKRTYETVSEHAMALNQSTSELIRQIVIEWAMLQRAGSAVLWSLRTQEKEQ